MTKAKVIQFRINKVIQNQNKAGVYAIFSKEEADSFMKYHQLGVQWRNEHRKDTFYEGYPHKPPGEALIEGLVWFTDEQKNFGVWIYNKSGEDIVVNEDIEFGWSPFVRKSVAPPNEPVHIQSAEFRRHLVWFVDENGFGQYGVIQKDGEIWLPHPKKNEQ